MKKIININLSGRVIPIEDSAYESLQRYIESLRRYFANEEGRDEIINDIESRVAELMDDKVRKGSTAITDADMSEIISSMGSVEDFEAADAAETGPASEQTGGGYTYNKSERRFRGRLHRDSSDKMIGGVCAGIANYMNVDPAIVRLLFAIITFGGFGAGFLLYILLWIILPAKGLDSYTGKRLFRNPDDRIIGGVAGGLAAYFNKQPWMIRLIFAAPLILNIFLSIINGAFSPWNHNYRPVDFAFGSFTGTFIIIYIVLWIVLPEAKSLFEKMEMRGEKVDVNRIRQNVQEGMTDFRNRAEVWSQEVKTSAQSFGQKASEFATTRSKTFASEVSQAARPVGNGCGHVIGVLFKAFFLFIAGTIAFALFSVVLAFIFTGAGQPVRDFLLDGYVQNAALWGVLIFFLAVPLIAIITWIVRRTLKVRSQNRYLGWIFGGLWTLGWVCLFMFIASMGNDWRTYSKVEQPITMQSSPFRKLTVRIDEPEIRYSGNFTWLHDNDGDGDGGWDLTEDSLHMSNVKINVRKSTDSFYHATVWKYSAGENRREALTRAEKVVYSASSLDSVLILGSGFGIGKANKFRGQKVMVEIKVPVGKKIMFDESIEGKLHEVNIRVSERRRWGRDEWDMDWD
ncbi:MAG TPA: PspC domain-containing protein, partial [Chitinophagaceae bacterium]|nr:PspC domain-containing protein [Chitinophagaceae bacterium]